VSEPGANAVRPRSRRVGASRSGVHIWGLARAYLGDIGRSRNRAVLKIDLQTPIMGAYCAAENELTMSKPRWSGRSSIGTAREMFT
jgi:hypothetical protein